MEGVLSNDREELMNSLLRGKGNTLEVFGLGVSIRENRSHRCFGLLPPIDELFATSRNWSPQR